MNLNNVFAYGSTVNVLLKCYVDMTINGKNFKAGEPYTLLKGVHANIASQTYTSATSTDAPKAAALRTTTQSNYMYQLTFSGITLTDKIRALFFNSADKIINTDIIVLEHEVTKIEVTPVDIWFYIDGVLATTNDYIYENGWFTINNYNTSKKYQVMITYEDASFMKLSPEMLPYFSAVIYGVGNTSGQTSDYRFVFDKLALLPDAAFDSQSQNQIDIVFGIIDSDKTVAMKL